MKPVIAYLYGNSDLVIRHTADKNGFQILHDYLSTVKGWGKSAVIELDSEPQIGDKIRVRGILYEVDAIQTLKGRDQSINETTIFGTMKAYQGDK